MAHWLIAYIDPGAGSLVIQALIASVVAVPFFFRRQIARAARALRRTKARSGASGQRADIS
jgi:hypothetical protein